MAEDPNSPKVVRDETLRLATTHLAETAIAKSQRHVNKEIREIFFTIIAMPFIAIVVAGTAIELDQIWIGVIATVIACAIPALVVLLVFKMNDRRQLNNRLIAEYELRRKYKRI